MGREKRRKYWYGSVLNMIKHYDQVKKENSERARTYTKAIEEALEETRQQPDGELKVKAIDLLYFRKTNTVQGTALKVYAGERTVKRWASAFVYLVGVKVGFE